jgi:hypothetical protein
VRATLNWFRTGSNNGILRIQYVWII